MTIEQRYKSMIKEGLEALGRSPLGNPPEESMVLDHQYKLEGKRVTSTITFTMDLDSDADVILNMVDSEDPEPDIEATVWAATAMAMTTLTFNLQQMLHHASTYHMKANTVMNKSLDSLLGEDA